jgi:uncharacterized repeat protein (TIGR01451 family)
VTVFGPPSLTVQSSHSAPFVIGQTNTYTLQVSNAAAARTTSGTVTVTENLPAGLTLVSMSGSTWTCGGNTCTTTVTEAGGNSFYPITVNAGVERHGLHHRGHKSSRAERLPHQRRAIL